MRKANSNVHRKAFNKKAVLYTVSLTLIVSVLLSLAILFFRHASAAEERHVELSFAQKIYDLDTSVQGVFREALRRSNVEASSTLGSMTVHENRPLDIEAMDSLLTGLESDIENHLNINITLASFLNTHSLMFLPLNITIEHASADELTVLPSQKITGYDIRFDFSGNITACSGNILDGGALSFSLHAESAADSCTFNQNGVSFADIDIIVSGIPVFITVNSDRSLNIESSAPAESNLTILFDELAQQGHFEAAIKVEIHDPAFNFSKSGFLHVS